MGRPNQSRRSEIAFAQLEPRTHYISEAAVKKKWKRLSTSSQDNIRDVLVSARTLSDRKNRRGKAAGINAQDAVEETVKRLADRLPRMPFPPANSDEAFDLELTLHRIQNMEQQLTDNMHSMNLLRAQIRKEEQLLETDKDEVELLRTSLKSNNALRKQQSKNLHAIAQQTIPSCGDREAASGLDALGVEVQEAADLYDLQQDASIAPMLQQLKDHLHSMQSNTADMQTIIESMTETGVLLNLLDLGQIGAT